jgi:hypothetical protein
MVPILSQNSPVHTTLSYLLMIQFNIIHHLSFGLPSGLFPSGLPTISYVHSSSPQACCVPCPSHSPWLYHCKYLAKNTTYEAPHYAVFFNLPSLHLSSVEIIPWTPCSQTPSVYVSPLIFHTRTEPQTKLYLYILIFTFLESWRA